MSPPRLTGSEPFSIECMASIYVIRISWCSPATQLVQAEEVQVYMVKNCEYFQVYPYESAHDCMYNSEDEIHPELRFTGAGILAMANSGPNTNGQYSPRT